MTAASRGSVRPEQPGSIRIHLLGALIASGLVMTASAGSAQEPTPRRIDGEIVTPVEIGMRTVNAEIQCNPRRVLLPPGDLLALNIVNKAERPIMFVAPEFFEAAEIIDVTDVIFDAALGGFLAPSEARVEILFRTPPPGEYGYVCYERFEQPTLESSGFMVVAPPPD